MKLSANKQFIFGIAFKSFWVYGIALVPSLFMAFEHAEDAVSESMLAIIVICIVIGVFGSRYFKDTTDTMKVVSMRVCYATTIGTWFILIFLSALPYYFAPPSINFVDCLYESCASWTTTGSSTISVADLPASLQLWHSTCNWLGGLGIIFLTLQLLPNWQFVGQNLAATELPGPGFLKLKSTFRKAYRRILLGYVLMTSLEFALLFVNGMDLFNSLLTCLSSTSTAGLLHINNGIITKLPINIKAILTIFAFFGSVNFSIPIMLLLGRFKIAFKGSEFRFHCAKIAIMTLFVSGSIMLVSGPSACIHKFADVFMQVVSIASTSGYILTDCQHWPSIAKSFIVLTMFIGACAVSTGGGLKNARFIILLKTSIYGTYKHLHPHSIRTLSYNREPLKNQTVIRANLYILMFMALYIAGATLLSLDDVTVDTALYMSEAMITNTGTIITEIVNGGQITGWSSLSKVVMMFLMLAGRLEIYPMLLLFYKSFWLKSTNK